jgi:hypothetical protein
MLAPMSKILYARIPDDAHDWITARAEARAVSMGEIVRRIVDYARAAERKAHVVDVTQVSLFEDET